VPVYRFRCRTCGTFDADHPMATVPDAGPCPSCGASARRIITAPALGRGGSTAMRLIDATSATADTPAVVSGVAPGRSTRPPRPVSRDPRHQKLPRP